MFRNDVFTIKGHDHLFRLISAAPATDEAWIIRLGDRKALPVRKELSELLKLKKSGNLALHKGGPAISPNRASPAAIQRRDIAWERIKPLLALPGIFDPATRNRLIEERMREVGFSKQTLYNDLRKYWQGGQTKEALLPNFHKSGRSIHKQPEQKGKKETVGETAGRGRKPTLGKEEIFQVTTDDIKNINKAIKKYYLSGKESTAAGTYQRALENHFSFIDGNGKRTVSPLSECPSMRQFRRILKQLDPELVIRRRKGDKEFEQNHRAKLGSAQLDCLGVGHIYEIDATVADVFVVSSRDRSRIIGKPTLYLIYDRRSRLVVGFYVGLEAASWPAAMQAILSIAQDKAALCQRYGVPYDPADWPAHGVFPQTFVGDRGEMASRDSGQLVKGLGIIVVNLPSQRPDYKGTVECGFKLIQRSMADSVPGYEPPENVFKRRGKKYSKDACLTVDEFTSLILANIIAHNRKAMRGYPLTAEQLSKGALAIPRDIWADEIPSRMGVLTRYDEDHVRFALLPNDQATVTREGILFRGCYYTCQKAVEDKWFVRAARGTFNVTVSYDRRLTDCIYLHDATDKTNFHTATMLEKSRNYMGLSFEEVRVYEKIRAGIRQQSDAYNRQVQSDFHEHADPITDFASRETKRVSEGKSRSAKKKDIVEDRLDERRIRRTQEATMASAKVSPDSPKAEVIALSGRKNMSQSPDKVQNEITPKSTSLQEKLRQIAKEMLDGKA